MEKKSPDLSHTLVGFFEHKRTYQWGKPTVWNFWGCPSPARHLAVALCLRSQDDSHFNAVWSMHCLYNETKRHTLWNSLEKLVYTALSWERSEMTFPPSTREVARRVCQGRCIIIIFWPRKKVPAHLPHYPVDYSGNNHAINSYQLDSWHRITRWTYDMNFEFCLSSVCACFYLVFN